MICTHCSMEVPEGAKFCGHCGQPILPDDHEAHQEARQEGTVCSNCLAVNPVGAHFCRHCGQALHHENQPHQNQDQSTTVFKNISSRINKMAGLENPEELELRSIFSKVLTKHTEEEAESVFIVGTPKTTPEVPNIAETWPKPWFFSRVFFILAIAFIGMYIGVVLFQNINFLPGLIFLGAVMVPATCLVFFWEMNAPQNISLYSVVKMFLIGGVLSLLVTSVFYQIAGTSISSTIVVGIVEEVGKFVAVFWFLRSKKYKYILNGMLIGAAVGAGFGAFETAGYLLRSLSSFTLFNSTMFWRSILAPGGHVVWAALSGAAFALVKGDKKFDSSMFGDFRFLRILMIVIVLHALWDGINWWMAGVPVAKIILTVISWVIMFAFMGTGLKQISQKKIEIRNIHNNLSV